MSRKIVNGLIVLSVALCLPCSILTVFAGGGVVTVAFSGPEEVNIVVDAPETVSKGEQFALTVRVTNLAAQPQSLDSIDVSRDYLAGIEILEVNPSFSAREENVGFDSYYFYHEISPGQSATVEFKAAARKPGHYAGDIDVCINSPFSCLTAVGGTLVK